VSNAIRASAAVLGQLAPGALQTVNTLQVRIRRGLRGVVSTGSDYADALALLQRCCVAAMPESDRVSSMFTQDDVGQGQLNSIVLGFRIYVSFAYICDRSG
jgi:hypothetical protein